MYWASNPNNSSIISTENAVPSKPENKENIRYNVPISFRLLDKNQRSNQRDIFEVFDSKDLLPSSSVYSLYRCSRLLKVAIKGEKVNI